MTTATRVLTGTRLSELAVCARRCACRALGHEPAEPTVQQQRYMSRGQLMEVYVRRQFAAKYGPDDIEAQVEIPWALGVGHADILVKSERLLVEVFSTTGSTIDHKIRQARLYLLNCPDADAAAVYVVDPSSLEREELVPVFTTDTDLDEMETLITSVQAAVEGGPLPDCVHTSPTGCRFSGCPFTDQAWAGWMPPDPLDVSDSPAFVQLAGDFYRKKRAREGAKALLEAADQEYGDAKDALSELLVLPGQPYTAGPFQLQRTAVKGKETFSLSRARASRAWMPADDERFGPFVKISDGHSLISIRRVSDELAPEDFGEAPF